MRRVGRGVATVWRWIGVHKDHLTVIFAAVAGIYVLIEYNRNEIDANIKRTMEFQARYGQSEILSSRLKLESFWLNPDSDAQLAQESGTEAEKITKLVYKNKLDGNVFVLADFFGQVTTCLRNDLCHVPTSCAAFKSHVVALRNTYFNLFKNWEKRWGENFIDDPYNFFIRSCPSK